MASAHEFIDELELNDRQRMIAERVLKEINARLRFLVDVGLDYLSLDRAAGTLSGGEAQRIRLATQIGSGLVGVLYVLDEPSIGLHQRDNHRLIETLVRLKGLGNTLIVVEHDEDTIRTADWVVDIGPGAGEHGGRIVHSGSLAGLMKSKESITGATSRAPGVPLHGSADPLPGELNVHGAREKTVATSPVASRSASSSRSPACPGRESPHWSTTSCNYAFGEPRSTEPASCPGRHTRSPVVQVDKVVGVDQSADRAHARSNPATYTGSCDHIRKRSPETTEAKVRGYGPGRFSFNVKGGRCENCAGTARSRLR